MRSRPSNETVLHALIIARDQGNTAQRLARALQRTGQGDAQVAHNTEEALNLLSAQRWDAVLWDVSGPILPGMPGLREILARQPGAAVLVLTGLDELPMAVRALEAGASSYLLLGPHSEIALEPLLAAALDTVSLRGHLARAEDRGAVLSSRLRLVGELTQDAFFVVSPAGGVLWANSSAESLVGRPASEILGAKAAGLFRPSNLIERVLAVLSGQAHPAELVEQGGAVLSSGDASSIVGLEAFLRQTSGSFLLVNLSAGSLSDKQGRLAEVVVVASPISQEHFLSQELAASNRRLDGLLGLVADAIAFLDDKGTIAKLNRRFADLVGAADEAECIGRPAGELLGEPQAVSSLLSDALDRTTEVTASLQVHRADGARVPVALRAAAVRDRNGDPLGALLVLEAEAPEGAQHQELRHPTEARLLLRSVEAAQEAKDWPDSRPVLDMVLDMACSALPSDAAALLVTSGDAGDLLMAHRGLSLELVTELAQLAARKLPATPGVAPPKPTLVPSLEAYMAEAEDKHLAGLLLAEGLNSCAFVPLAAGDHPLGLLFLGAARAGSFGQSRPDDLAVVAAEAAAIAAALVSQIRLRQEQAAFSEVARLALDLARASDVTEIVTAAVTTAVRGLKAQWAAAHVLDARREELEFALRADAGGEVTARATMPATAHDAAWQAIEHGRTVVRGDESEGARTTLAAAPLRADTEVMGALIVAWQGQRRLSDDETKLLELIARKTGIAVLHTRVFEEETSRISQIRAAATEALELEARARSLLQAAAAVEELTELDDILASLAEAGLRIIGLEQISIYLADYEKGQLTGAVLASEPDAVRPLMEKWPLQKGDSVYADAALSDNPYLVAAVESASGQYEAALIPLRTQAALVGLLVGANPSTGRQLSPQDLRLLRALGGLASVAIDRARVDQMRDMMARSVSHELRAPLASTRAYVEVVLDEGVGPINQEQRVFLQRAANACDYLQRLVEDLLDLSRLRAGEISLQPTITDVRELIEQIIDSLRVRVDENNVEIDVQVAPEVAELMVDRTRLAQVLTNLIDNAVKFNYHGGRVTVVATLEGREVTVAVTDTGPGIPEGECEAIFDEFYRGKNEMTQTRSGAGLGLAIARRVTTFLGGTLTVESEVGHGSTFFLRFPYHPPDTGETPEGHTEVTEFGPGERLESSDRRR